jgi:hypothetical protein
VAGCGGAHGRLGRRWSRRVGEGERGGVAAAAVHPAGKRSEAAQIAVRKYETSFF